MQQPIQNISKPNPAKFKKKKEENISLQIGFITRSATSERSLFFHCNSKKENFINSKAGKN